MRRVAHAERRRLSKCALLRPPSCAIEKLWSIRTRLKKSRRHMTVELRRQLKVYNCKGFDAFLRHGVAYGGHENQPRPQSGALTVLRTTEYRAMVARVRGWCAAGPIVPRPAVRRHNPPTSPWTPSYVTVKIRGPSTGHEIYFLRLPCQNMSSSIGHDRYPLGAAMRSRKKIMKVCYGIKMVLEYID